MAPDKPGLHNGNFVTKLVLIVKIQLKKRSIILAIFARISIESFEN